jgi:hypothetical protein
VRRDKGGDGVELGDALDEFSMLVSAWSDCCQGCCPYNMVPRITSETRISFRGNLLRAKRSAVSVCKVTFGVFYENVQDFARICSISRHLRPSNPR